MFFRRIVLLRLLLTGVFLCLASTLWAQNPPPREEPEQPDFAFVSGSAYTQVKNTMQFIHQTAYRTRRFTDLGGRRRNEDDFLFFQRLEYGLTDRWEVDVVFPVAGSRTRLDGATIASQYAWADGLLGIRYQLLDEEKAPLTLTTGPQVIFPSGSVRSGTGTGSTGFAWDFAASKDWRGPVFLYTTFNYHVLPSADDTTPGSSAQFILHGLDWATAIGFRALERQRRHSRHDLHILLEGGGSWKHEVEPGVTMGTRQGKLSWVVSPGIRYGFLTPRKTLIEIGVGAPVGPGPNGPKCGIFVQFQYEFYFRPPPAQ